MTMFLTRHLTPLIQLTEDMEAMRKQLNRAFYDEGTNGLTCKAWLVPVELSETPEAYQVEALVPGLKPEQLNVQASEKSLTLEGGWQARERGENEKLHHSEFSYGKFTRVIEFVKPILHEQIEAVYDQGVLRLTLPKKETSERKQVRIKVHSQIQES